MSKINNQKTTIQLITQSTKSTKITKNEISTGICWWYGKNRLCKLVKVKDAELVSLEVNVEIETDNTDYQHITGEFAYKHHLGTMKGHLKTKDMDLVKDIITKAVAKFKQVNKI